MQKPIARRRSARRPTSPTYNSTEDLDELDDAEVDTVHQQLASLAKLRTLTSKTLDDLSTSEGLNLREQAQILAAIATILAKVIPLERELMALEDASDAETPMETLRRQLFANARTFRPVEDDPSE